jgi:hypothetical protein
MSVPGALIIIGYPRDLPVPAAKMQTAWCGTEDPNRRRAIPVFRDPVTTLAVSVHAQLQHLRSVRKNFAACNSILAVSLKDTRPLAETRRTGIFYPTDFIENGRKCLLLEGGESLRLRPADMNTSPVRFVV